MPDHFFLRPAQCARWLKPRGLAQLIDRLYFCDHFSAMNSLARTLFFHVIGDVDLGASGYRPATLLCLEGLILG